MAKTLTASPTRRSGKRLAAEIRRLKFLWTVGQQALERYPGQVPAAAELAVDGEAFYGPKLRKLKVLSANVDAAELRQIQALMREHQRSVGETALFYIAAISSRERRIAMLRQALSKRWGARQIQDACSPHLSRKAAENVGRVPEVGTNLKSWKRRLGEQAHSMIRTCEAVEAAAEKKRKLPRGLMIRVSQLVKAARRLQEAVRK